MEITWLRKAVRNLEQEAENIAQDDPDAAQLVVARIREAVAMLADNPALGRAGRITGTRELTAPNARYIIPHRVRGSRVEILRVSTLPASYRSAGKPPKAIREHVRLRPKQKLTLIEKDGLLILVAERSLDSLRGIAAGAHVSDHREKKDRWLPLAGRSYRTKNGHRN